LPDCMTGFVNACCIGAMPPKFIDGGGYDIV
jgi:hypothetical protein